MGWDGSSSAADAPAVTGGGIRRKMYFTKTKPIFWVAFLDAQCCGTIRYGYLSEK